MRGKYSYQSVSFNYLTRFLKLLLGLAFIRYLSEFAFFFGSHRLIVTIDLVPFSSFWTILQVIDAELSGQTPLPEKFPGLMSAKCATQKFIQAAGTCFSTKLMQGYAYMLVHLLP
jgi:hypothetical protein